MLYLAIVCAVVAVAFFIWGVTRARAASSSAVRAAALEERVQGLDADLGAAHLKITALDTAVQQANERADQQTQKAREVADEARRSDEMAEDAVQRAIRAETDAAEASLLLEQAEALRAAAVADRDATIAGAGPLHPDALWALEVRRIERLWRDRLALQPDEPSPFAADPDDLGVVLRVFAEASREESGVVIEVTWDLVAPIPADRRVQLARIGEELVAAMRDREGGELEVVAGADDRIDLRLTTSPPVELSDAFTAALALIDVVPTVEDGVVIIGVPPRGDSGEPAGADDDVESGDGDDGADGADGAGADASEITPEITPGITPGGDVTAEVATH